MNKLESIIDPDKVICKNVCCIDKGRYQECYLHVYLIQPCFRDYYNQLNDEQREILFCPENFYMF